MILLIVVIILLIYLFFGKKCFNIMDNIDTFDNSVKQKQCCLIKKEYAPDSNSMYKGDFKYKYQKLYDNSCNINLYDQDSNQQLFIDGENDWDNKLCTDQNIKVGSCRRNNKECVDFLQKKDCDKYYMNWYNKSCQDEPPFVFTDNIVKPSSIEDIDPNAISYDTINNNKQNATNDLFPVSEEQIKNVKKEYSTMRYEIVNLMV